MGIDVQHMRFRWLGEGRALWPLQVLFVPEGAPATPAFLQCKDLIVLDQYRDLRFRLVYNDDKRITTPLPIPWQAADAFKVEAYPDANRLMTKTLTCGLTDPDFHVWSISGLPDWSHFYISITPKVGLGSLDGLYGIEFDSMINSPS